jgi:hypothetical protein
VEAGRAAAHQRRRSAACVIRGVAAGGTRRGLIL